MIMVVRPVEMCENISIFIKELKEKLDANLILEYAKKNFKLDISNFIITEDNKIN